MSGFLRLRADPFDSREGTDCFSCQVNILPALDSNFAADYAHVSDYSQGFGEKVTEIFSDDSAPSDPMMVAKLFESLIDTPAGQRPLRTMAGLDFGSQAINDAVEPIRLGLLEALEIDAWDGPKADSVVAEH